MRILIAEDDFIGRKLLQKFLSQYGNCDIAVNGLEALDAYVASEKNKTPYDLICLDVMMPKIDGLKVLRTIRDIEKKNGVLNGARVKVIMTTALNDRKTIAESYDAGCEAYAWKPIDLEKLKDVLKKMKLIPS